MGVKHGKMDLEIDFYNVQSYVFFLLGYIPKTREISEIHSQRSDTHHRNVRRAITSHLIITGAKSFERVKLQSFQLVFVFLSHVLLLLFICSKFFRLLQHLKNSPLNPQYSSLPLSFPPPKRPSSPVPSHQNVWKLFPSPSYHYKREKSVSNECESLQSFFFDFHFQAILSHPPFLPPCFF